MDSICEFLDRIGIPYQETTLEQDTFLPGLTVEHGKVLVDRERLTYPGDFLHEAGHVALTKPELRCSVDQAYLGAQDPQESEEIGVLLWTYLAAREIGLPLDAVFHAGGYKGQSNWLIEQFAAGNYIGLPLLTWMGITEPGQPGQKPKVVSWLRVAGE